MHIRFLSLLLTLFLMSGTISLQAQLDEMDSEMMDDDMMDDPEAAFLIEDEMGDAQPEGGKMNSLVAITFPDDWTGISIGTYESELYSYFLLENKGTNPLILEDLKFSDFINATGDSVKLSPTSEGQPIPPLLEIPVGKWVKIELSGSVPRLGSYNGFLSASGAEGNYMQRMIIKRYSRTALMEAPFFEIEDIGGVHATAGDVKVGITVRDLNGGGGQIYLPSLTLKRRGLEDEWVQAEYDKVEFRWDNGEELKAKNLIESGQSPRINAHFLGLTKAGSYQAKLRIAGPTSKETTMDLNLKVKKGLGWAILWITLGVLISWGLSAFFKSKKPRMQAQNNVLAVRDELGDVKKRLKKLQEDEETVYNRMISEITALYDKLESELVADIEAKTLSLQLRAGNFYKWVITRRRAEKVEDSVVAGSLFEQLGRVQDYLEGRETAEGFDAGKILDSVNLSVERAELIVSAEKLVKVLPFRVESLAEGSSLRTDLDEINSRTVAFRNGSFPQGKAGVSSLRSLLHRVTPKITAHMASQLRKSFNVEGSPLGISDGQWEKNKAELGGLLTKVEAETSIEKASRLYKRTYKKYLNYLAGGITTYLSDLKKDLIQKKVNEDFQGEKDGLLQELEDHSVKANVMMGSIADNKLQVAQELCQQLQFEILQTQQFIDQLGNEGDDRGLGEILRRPFEIESKPEFMDGSVEIPEESDVSWNSRKLPSAKFFNAKWLIFNGVANFFVLFLSVLSGIYLLYLESASWGSLGDVITAILWGGGLHSLTTTSKFDTGTADYLTDKFSGTSTVQGAGNGGNAGNGNAQAPVVAATAPTVGIGMGGGTAQNPMLDDPMLEDGMMEEDMMGEDEII